MLAVLLTAATFHTCAPVPPRPMPDPMARGYVGVTLGEGCVVSGVEPKTPAERAGLRSGDVIVRVGTLVPADYGQVVEHICSFRPGATVEVEVERGGARKTFKLTLACRPIELDEGRVPVPIID